MTIMSTLTIQSIDDYHQGSYECVGKHLQISAGQIFHVQINSTDMFVNSSLESNSVFTGKMMIVH